MPKNRGSVGSDDFPFQYPILILMVNVGKYTVRPMDAMGMGYYTCMLVQKAMFVSMIRIGERHFQLCKHHNPLYLRCVQVRDQHVQQEQQE